MLKKKPNFLWIFIILLALPLVNALDNQTSIPFFGDTEFFGYIGDSQFGIFIAPDPNPPNVTLISPLSGAEITSGIVTFSFNVTDVSSVQNCSLYLDNSLDQTDITITKNIEQSFTVLNIKKSDNLKWYINCTDFFNNIGSSSIYNLDTKLGGSGTGVGGTGGDANTIAKSLDIENLSSRVCELTYNSAQRETLKYIEIDDIIAILKLETNEDYSFTTIQTYIDNWQPLCSDLINRTLKPKLVCEKIYNFTISHNYIYDLEDVIKLKKELESNITLSLNLVIHYVNNYNKLCYNLGYSEKLGKEVKPIVIPGEGGKIKAGYIITIVILSIIILVGLLNYTKLRSYIALLLGKLRKKKSE